MSDMPESKKYSVEEQFKSEGRSLEDLLGNGKKYEVPDYQRDYSWKESHWADLWDDLLRVYNGDSYHYMSSIVLMSIGTKQYEIIDGQQRLITLTIIILAAKKILEDLHAQNKNPEDKDRAERLLKYIGEKEIDSLHYNLKLKLNKINNHFYQEKLSRGLGPAVPAKEHDSNKLMWKCFEYYLEVIRSKFEKDSDCGYKISNFIKTIMGSLGFTEIVVSNELNASRIFESLNNDGLQLTVNDLLKNHFFRSMKGVDLGVVKDKWERLEDIIPGKKFPSFLRHYWIAKYEIVRSSGLYRVINDNINQPDQVLALLDELEKYSYTYMALQLWEDEYWRASEWSGDKDIVECVKELNLFRERQSLPLLMLCYEKFRGDFKKVLQTICTIAFRYSVICSKNPNIKEVVFNQACLAINSGAIKNFSDVIKYFESIYPSDSEFKTAFSSLSIDTGRNKYLVRYILYKIQNFTYGTIFPYGTDKGTIEHILPENPSDEWKNSFPTPKPYIKRLGNYTILEPEKNQVCKNKGFVYKNGIYKDSNYSLTSSISYNDWTVAALEERQSSMADIACKIWKIEELS